MRNSHAQKLVLTRRGQHAATILGGTTLAGFFIGAHYLIAAILGGAA